MTQRLGWIDRSKGIGIFLVILGHASLPYEVSKFIFSFHIPLFFFLSGYLFYPTKHPFFFRFVKEYRIAFQYRVTCGNSGNKESLGANIFGDARKKLYHWNGETFLYR